MSFKPGYLYDVAILRVLLIILLVLYHAFAPFSGAWAPIDHFPEINAYCWFDKLCYACLLEMFVFISGYTFGFQVKVKGKAVLDFSYLIKNKFKRLIIPCVVFSFIYILLFQDIKQPFEIILYDLFNGVGHMWYLPMLFWCFIFVWIIEALDIKVYWALPFIFFFSACSVISLPFEMKYSMYYFLFFYIGYTIQRKNVELNKYYNVRNVLILFAVFSLLFPVLTLLINYLQICPAESLLKVKVISSLCNICRIIYSSVGLFFLLFIVNVYLKQKGTPVSKWIVEVSGMCMGVYLFQQFILKIVYNSSVFPDLIGPILLPIFASIITLAISLLLSFLFRQTRIGKSLIG